MSTQIQLHNSKKISIAYEKILERKRGVTGNLEASFAIVLSEKFHQLERSLCRWLIYYIVCNAEYSEQLKKVVAKASEYYDDPREWIGSRDYNTSEIRYWYEAAGENSNLATEYSLS